MTEKNLQANESAYLKLNVALDKYEALKNVLEEHEIDYQEIVYFSECKRIKIKASDQIKLKDYAWITIKPLHTVTHFGMTVPDGDNTEIQTATDHPDGIKLGLLDSGVKKQYGYASYIQEKYLESVQEHSLNLSHGTFIAGQWLYQREPFLYRGAQILSVPIVTTALESEDVVLLRIIEAIKDNPDIKVWNLAISVNAEIEDQRFSDMAIVLDYLQRTYDCIISKTVANNFFFLDSHFKINQGADSLEALTVGSINRHNNKRSAFSRIGKGPFSVNKPDLVYYGGDVYLDESQPLSQEAFRLDGLKSLSATSGLRQACGSSFASPAISKVAAEVWARNPQFTRLEVKALLIHNSYAHQHHEALGFGKLSQTENILNSIQRIYRRTLHLEEDTSYSLSLNPKFTYQVTLVSEAQLNYAEPENYIQSHLFIEGYDESLSNHKSFQVHELDTLNIQNKGGTSNAILLVEQI